MGYPSQDPHNQKPLKYPYELQYFLCRKKRCIQELRGIHPITGKPPFWDKGWFRRSDEYDELILKACLSIRQKIKTPLEKEYYEANVANLRQAILKKASMHQKGSSKAIEKNKHRLEFDKEGKQQRVIPKNEFLVYHGMQDLAHRTGVNPSHLSLEEIVNQYRKSKGLLSAEETIGLIAPREMQKLTDAGYNAENIYRFMAVYHYTHYKAPHVLDPARKDHMAPEHIIDAVLRWETSGDLVDPYHS